MKSEKRKVDFESKSDEIEDKKSQGRPNKQINLKGDDNIMLSNDNKILTY